jgi:hypothetical protein
MPKGEEYKLVMVHRQTGEELLMTAIAVGHPPCFYLTLPMMGEYVFDLQRNWLNRARDWTAVDIKQAWHLWYQVMGPERSAVDYKKPFSGRKWGEKR